jgi:glycosyltransferase involved in cell wall biosynthesis
MNAVLQGVTLLYALGPVGKVPSGFRSFAYGRIAGVPIGATVAVALCVPAVITLSRGEKGLADRFILYVGTIEPRKNQVRLIRAYRQAAPDVPHALVLAGPDGWGVAEVDAEIARPGPGRIARTGPLEAGDLDAVYRGADLVAYVSLYEGFGLPVLEAMGRGVAVLASTTPAVAETAGDAALLVDPNDVAAIADGLARLLGDPALRGDLVVKGRARAASSTWAATARATLDAYRRAEELARP